MASEFESITSARRLLVVMPSWVGDCVMATPILRAVRRTMDTAGHEVFIAGYVRPHMSSLFDGCAELDACIGSRPGGMLGLIREAKRLRAFNFDTVVLLPNSFRSAWLTRLARIPRRIGYARDYRGFLLTDRIRCPHADGDWKRPMPAIEHYLKLLEPVGVKSTNQNANEPRLHVGNDELTKAHALLHTSGIESDEPVALLNPGASQAGKRWPIDRFAAMADWLHDAYGMRIVINGAPGERALTGELSRRIRRARVLELARHETSLATLAALTSLADLVITNDTGTRHIAAAVGFSRLRQGETGPGLITIFGEVQPAWTTLNYPMEAELWDRDSRRVDTITVKQVMDATRRLLAERPMISRHRPSHS